MKIPAVRLKDGFENSGFQYGVWESALLLPWPSTVEYLSNAGYIDQFMSLVGDYEHWPYQNLERCVCDVNRALLSLGFELDYESNQTK